MRYATIKENDIVDGEGVCVSVWVQGCPFKCKGCHNPETWDFNGGIEEPDIFFVNRIIDLIKKNGVKRNLSILGGEPLAPQHRKSVATLVTQVKKKYPDIKIFLWTGYTIGQLLQENDEYINTIFNEINILVDGPYIEELRDITLKFRGSSNQKIHVMPLK